VWELFFHEDRTAKLEVIDIFIRGAHLVETCYRLKFFDCRVTLIRMMLRNSRLDHYYPMAKEEDSLSYDFDKVSLLLTEFDQHYPSQQMSFILPGRFRCCRFDPYLKV